ncbi:MAG TPA: serine hydrolase domain-containing protein [Aggregatilineales bacterium]|nr:serine hydrolase domain-containing protein [Aggregatilineales bacterium]
MTVEHALPRSQPEREGIASSAILQFVEALESQMHELHSFMLLRHGHVVAEAWWSPYRPDYPHLMFSVSKSLTSTAVGMAITEGRLSIDDPVLSFFPDESPAKVSDFLASMTVRHLLTMTTGHGVDTWPYLIARSDGHWIKAFLDVPVAHPPGTHFLYNTGATYILSAIVQKTTGMKLIDYLQPRLFEPLGIRKATWQQSPQGIAVGGYGLSMTTEDLARFGQLYLQKGRWEDRQILTEAWVEAATSAQVSGSNRSAQSDWTQGYGYQFWCCRHDAYQASGVFGQGCIVMPRQDAVFAFTGGIEVFDVQQLLDLVWTALLPALEVEQPAEDAVAQQARAQKLSSLALAPVHFPQALSLPPHFTSRTYEVDVNDLSIESIALDFNQPEYVITFNTPGGQETLHCSYGEWRQGRTNLFNGFNGPWLSGDPTLVAASGGWTGEDCFTVVVRLLETPFYYRLAYHFIDDEMLLEMQVNVTLEVPKTLLLTAHLSARGI